MAKRNLLRKVVPLEAPNNSVRNRVGSQSQDHLLLLHITLH
jgi:hypothetical protein